MCGPHDRWELVEGELVKMAPTGDYASAVAIALGRHLGNHVAPRRLGVVFGADAGFILGRNPDTMRSPAVAFVEKTRLVGGHPATGLVEVVPDIVVEVVSPSDSAEAVQTNALMWVGSGCRLALVVFPQTRLVAAFRSVRDVTHYFNEDSIDFAPVLPGFTLPVKSIFEDVDLSNS